MELDKDSLSPESHPKGLFTTFSRLLREQVFLIHTVHAPNFELMYMEATPLALVEIPWT